MTNPSHALPQLNIAICGGGLAGYMTAAALSRHLPDICHITFLVSEEMPAADIFYGNVTAQSAYDFNLSMGVSEPDLILDSNTAFSLGTQYKGWGGGRLEWIQGFQQPFPVPGGVPFHQYLTRMGIKVLEPYLVSASVAKRGAFAHPPEQATHALSRAEYGYQFEVAAYCKLFAAAMNAPRISVIHAGIADIQAGPGGIEALRLSDGQTVSADLFIDCTGPDAVLLSRLGVSQATTAQLMGLISEAPSETLGAAMRTLIGREFGWQSVTPLQDKMATLTVCVEGEEDAGTAAHGVSPRTQAKMAVGRRLQPWTANCVAIGQAAATIEPLTPAPIMLLQRDLMRLLSLIPLSVDMAMERREYNRQFDNDFAHAELFRQALVATAPLCGSAYWQIGAGMPLDAKLARKLTQFLNRGVLVSYDLEPFTPEDWLVLHLGMGRIPARGDRMADAPQATQVKAYLADLQRDIEITAAGLPSHHAYMTKLKQFLKQKRS